MDILRHVAKCCKVLQSVEASQDWQQFTEERTCFLAAAGYCRFDSSLFLLLSWDGRKCRQSVVERLVHLCMLWNFLASLIWLVSGWTKVLMDLSTTIRAESVTYSIYSGQSEWSWCYTVTSSNQWQSVTQWTEGLWCQIRRWGGEVLHSALPTNQHQKRLTYLWHVHVLMNQSSSL